VQGHKNTLSLPKLNSAYADGPVSWPDGLRRETEIGRQQTSLVESRTVRSSGPDSPPTIEMIFFRLFKRICILKPEALLALMQMIPFMLYEALSFTPIKFIDPS
jgi:hypothetical protein